MGYILIAALLSQAMLPKLSCDISAYLVEFVPGACFNNIAYMAKIIIIKTSSTFIYSQIYVFHMYLCVFYNIIIYVCIYFIGISRNHRWQQKGWLGARTVHISKANREMDQEEDLHTN